MSRYDGIRRRVAMIREGAEIGRGVQPTYKQRMHKRGLYLPVSARANRWKDESGADHVAVPAKPTAAGLRLGVPWVEVVDDIA